MLLGALAHAGAVSLVSSAGVGWKADLYLGIDAVELKK
jgi:hypothetical protein